MSTQRWRFVWLGLLLLCLMSIACSLLTYRGAALQNYLVGAAVVPAVFGVVAISEWTRRRRIKRD